jgi:thiamine-phosphate pyrophosphorylase
MFRLMLVTDRTLIPPARLPAVVDAAVRGGVDAVQLREKDLPADALIEAGRALRETTRGRALLLVNGPVAVARACGADGVHLPETAPMPDEAERRGLIVGRSVHGLQSAGAAAREGCDYLVVGTVFPSRSHPGGAAAGLDLVAAVRRDVAVPIVAIGGISAANAGGVVRAGADAVAVISAVLGAEDPEAAARALRAAIVEASSRSGMGSRA